MNSRVLITGANGLLGRSLRITLSQNQFDVIATGRGRDVMVNHDHIYEEMDIGVQENCEIVLNKYKPDFIVNTAAVTDVDKCEQDNDLCLSINTNSILHFMPFVQRNNVHFIHISTDFVFDGLDGPYQETDFCNPINFYGFSKLEAEQIITNNNLKYTILRTSLVYGKNDNKFNFATWVKDNLENEEQLHIVDDQYRTATFVDDLVDAILKVIQKKKYGLYHISSGEVLSIYQIVCNIAECYGLDMSLVNRIKSQELNQFAKRPLNSSLVIKKAIKDLDFKPTTFFNALT